MKLSLALPFLSALTAAPAESSVLRSGSRKLDGGNDDVEVSEIAVDDTVSVTYDCVVKSTWSGADHPVDYPSTAHLSPPVLVAHSVDYKLFTPGEPVSPGVQLVAEQGPPSLLVEELTAAGDAVKSYVVGVPMWHNEQPDGIPDGHIVGREQDITGLVFTPEQTYFSAISMLAPSPDWFSSSHGHQAIEDGFWLKSFSYKTGPYDAGTDGGMTFMADDVPLDPAEGSRMITVDNTPNGIFVDPTGAEILPTIEWHCTKVDVELVEQTSAAFGVNAQSVGVMVSVAVGIVALFL